MLNLIYSYLICHCMISDLHVLQFNAVLRKQISQSRIFGYLPWYNVLLRMLKYFVRSIDSIVIQTFANFFGRNYLLFMKFFHLLNNHLASRRNNWFANLLLACLYAWWINVQCLFACTMQWMQEWVRPKYMYHWIVLTCGRIPDNKVHGADMGPIWGRQDPGGPHVGPMNFAIWDGVMVFIAMPWMSSSLTYYNITASYSFVDTSRDFVMN